MSTSGLPTPAVAPGPCRRPERSPLLESVDVSWAGRIVANPIALLGDLDAWEVYDGQVADHGPTGARLTRLSDEGALPASFELAAPVSGTHVRIPLAVDASVLDGGVPRVGVDEAATAMRELLTVAAGGSLAAIDAGAATVTVAWQADSVADHSGVTAATLPRNSDSRHAGPCRSASPCRTPWSPRAGPPCSASSAPRPPTPDSRWWRVSSTWSTWIMRSSWPATSRRRTPS